MEEIERGREAPAKDNVRASSGAAGTGDEAAVDLTGIDPVHWAETRERVAILRAWCANGRHPRSEALAAAARMGVTVSHFYRLVVTWRKHRDARLVSGHPARRGDPRGAQTIAAKAHAILLAVVDDRGADARFVDIQADVRSMCSRAGIPAPSSGMIHRAMMRARQIASPAVGGSPADITVAVVACLLPVAAASGTIDAPDLVLAVERPSGTIVAHRLVLDGDRIGAARSLLAQLAAGTDTPVVVAAALGDAVDVGAQGTDHARAGASDARIKVSTRSTLLSTTLGSYIDSIPIRHRRHAVPIPGPWSPLTPAAAATAIDLAVAAHNTARSG